MSGTYTTEALSKGRIIKEDLATDTVGNALFSINIAEQEMRRLV